MPHEKHPLCTPPSNRQVKIWRYLDFPQLIQILKRDKLFFSRADNFDDPYEGTLPEEHRKFRSQEESIPEDWAEKLLPKFRRICTKNTFLNCWHINEGESAAMWDLYLEANHGVCIQSTFQKLVDSIAGHEDDEIYVSKVRYIDYETDHLTGWHRDSPLGNSMSPFIHKRKHYDHEDELRAIVHSPSWRDSTGESLITAETIEQAELTEEALPRKVKPIEIDKNNLIERIHVSPNAGDWVERLLKDIVPDYGISEEKVGESGMSKEPGY